MIYVAMLYTFYPGTWIIFLPENAIETTDNSNCNTTTIDSDTRMKSEWIRKILRL